MLRPTHRSEFSDYIVYVDESGDHGLKRVDPDYPMFVLAFCIFEKSVYIERCVPALQRFKFDLFGHDMVVLHEHEIRKARGPFKALVNEEFRERFMSRLNRLVEQSPFTIVASAIRKARHKDQYAWPESPYNLALGFCMERLLYFLREREEHGPRVDIIFESRGRKEDNDLELEFRRVAGGASYSGETMPFEPHFVSKQTNCSGLQIADLVARPIGLSVLRPHQENRAYELIKPKFRTNERVQPLGPLKVEGYGLKIFP